MDAIFCLASLATTSVLHHNNHLLNRQWIHPYSRITDSRKAGLQLTNTRGFIRLGVPQGAVLMSGMEFIVNHIPLNKLGAQTLLSAFASGYANVADKTVDATPSVKHTINPTTSKLE